MNLDPSSRGAAGSGGATVAFRSLLLTIVLLAGPKALAFEATLLDPAGRAMRRAEISIAGRTGAVRTDGEGRFTILPEPVFPLTLIVVGSRGEIYPPLYVPSPGTTALQLEPAFKETITVTTGAAPNIETTAAAAATVIGSQEIEERKPEHLVDALAGTPGIAARGEGAPAVPVVRGLSGGRTLLVVDDARVVSERRAGPSAMFVNPFSLAAVEVARGPGSVAYGSDAMGGVVHARSRDPIPGQSQVRYDLWASGAGERAVSGAIEGSADLLGGAVLAALYARSAEDSYDAEGERILNSSYSDRGFALRYVSHLAESRIRLAVASDRAEDVGAPGADAATVRTYYPTDGSDRFSFALDHESGFEMRGSLAASSVETARERLPLPGVQGEINTVRVEARDASLRTATTRVGERSRLHAGADFVTRFGLRAVGTSSTAPPEVSIDDASKRDLGVFALYEHRLTPALSLSAGGRGDYITTENRGGFFGDRSRDDFALSGQAGLTGAPWRNVTATLQVSTGYREPSLSDRYFRGISGRGFVTGNPDLEPERSLQYDAMLRWRRGFSSLALSMYDYEIRNLVERFRTGTNFFFRNRGRASVRGLELEAEARPRESLSVRAGLAVARGEAVDDGAPLDDIAAPNASLEVRHAGTRHSLFATAAFYARDTRPGPVEVERPGYTTVDIGAGWQIRPQLEIRLLIRNATDRLYAGSSDENAAFASGRSVMLGVNGQWGE